MTGGERLVLLVGDRDAAAERSQDDAVPRKVESGERVHLELGTDMK